MSKLYFKYGTMGSTKSTMLLTSAYNFDQNNIPCLLLKPSIDNRDNANFITSRIKGLEHECLCINADVNIYDLIKQTIDIQMVKFQPLLAWILVDEAQFLTEEQVEQLASIVDNFDINVMCFGLRTDFKSTLFTGSKRLFELSDTIEEIKSVCSCGKKTIINARIDTNGNVLSIGEQILIGGNDSYVPLCRKCWKERKSKF